MFWPMVIASAAGMTKGVSRAARLASFQCQGRAPARRPTLAGGVRARGRFHGGGRDGVWHVLHLIIRQVTSRNSSKDILGLLVDLDQQRVGLLRGAAAKRTTQQHGQGYQPLLHAVVQIAFKRSTHWNCASFPTDSGRKSR